MTTLAEILHRLVDGTVTEDLKSWYHEVIDSVTSAVGLDQGKDQPAEGEPPAPAEPAPPVAEAPTEPAGPADQPAESAPPDQSPTFPT